MKKIRPFFTLFMALIFALGFLSPAFAETSEDSKASASSEKSVGSGTGEKGGIYVVGRGFKKAGGEMEKGFKAAGRGIKKGGQATGSAFKKAGGSIKNFFTGEKNEKE
jgi:hypothetical protein